MVGVAFVFVSVQLVFDQWLTSLWAKFMKYWGLRKENADGSPRLQKTQTEAEKERAGDLSLHLTGPPIFARSVPFCG